MTPSMLLAATAEALAALPVGTIAIVTFVLLLFTGLVVFNTDAVQAGSALPPVLVLAAVGMLASLNPAGAAAPDPEAFPSHAQLRFPSTFTARVLDGRALKLTSCTNTDTVTRARTCTCTRTLRRIALGEYDKRLQRA